MMAKKCNLYGRAPSGQATRASHEAPTGLHHTASVLRALADQCEQARGPDRSLDGAIWLGVFADDVSRKAYDEGLKLSKQEAAFRLDYMSDGARYTASLDAAMTLVPEGWDWSAGTSSVPGFPPAEASVYPQQQPFPVELDICTEAATPALALCAAALRARASGMEAPSGGETGTGSTEGDSPTGAAGDAQNDPADTSGATP